MALESLATNAELTSSTGSVQQSDLALRQHVSSNLATVHTGQDRVETHTYTDSNSNTWGTSTLVVTVNGVDYFVPVTIV